MSEQVISTSSVVYLLTDTDPQLTGVWQNINVLDQDKVKKFLVYQPLVTDVVFPQLDLSEAKKFELNVNSAMIDNQDWQAAKLHPLSPATVTIWEEISASSQNIQWWRKPREREREREREKEEEERSIGSNQNHEWLL